MPAKDIYHYTVKNALIKEGWIITDDPLFIQFGEVDMYADIGAERIIAAEKENQKIAVEVKSFLEASLVSAFHTAMGQYIDYRHALEELQSERILYLAVPLRKCMKLFLPATLFNQLSIALPLNLSFILPHKRLSSNGKIR